MILQVRSGVSEAEFRDETEEAAAFLGEDFAEIDGIGDAAYEVGGFVYTHQGEYELVMTNVLGLDPTDPEEEAQALDVNVGLMEKALSRLP